jgi:hypothetical protein
LTPLPRSDPAPQGLLVSALTPPAPPPAPVRPGAPAAPPPPPLSLEPAVQQTRLECLFLFSLVWSLGASVDGAGRTLFDTWLRRFLKVRRTGGPACRRLTYAISGAAHDCA